VIYPDVYASVGAPVCGCVRARVSVCVRMSSDAFILGMSAYVGAAVCGCECMWMCVCVRVRVCLYIFIFTYVYIDICIYILTYI